MSTHHVVILPWPPKQLSPNSRAHWAVKSREAKKYRAACAWACKEAKLHAPATDGRLHLWIDFYAPDRRHRDADNLTANIKSGLDGVADAIGINDKNFVIHPYLRDELGGYVEIKITPGPEVAR